MKRVLGFLAVSFFLFSCGASKLSYTIVSKTVDLVCVEVDSGDAVDLPDSVSSVLVKKEEACKVGKFSCTGATLKDTIYYTVDNKSNEIVKPHFTDYTFKKNPNKFSNKLKSVKNSPWASQLLKNYMDMK